MQPSTSNVGGSALTVGVVGMGKINPIIAKLKNILASGIGNTTVTTRSIVFKFEKLILVSDKVLVIGIR